MKKRYALLAVGLVGVLVLSGQLARAGGEGPAVPADSEPYWSSDDQTLAYNRDSPRPDNGHVLYTSPGPGGERDIIGTGRARGFQPGGGNLLVELDGYTSVRDATDHQVAVVQGTDSSWSPDGSRIAYLRDGVLYVASATGADATAIATGIVSPDSDRAGPVWSPTGEQIVIATTTTVPGPAFELVVANVDGSGTHAAFTGPTEIANPSWSPDGGTIAFERNDGPYWSIWFVDPAGADPRLALGGDANYRFPQFGPSGNRLAFISDRERLPGEASTYRYALWLETLDGGPPRRLVDDVRPDSPPRFSPTGTQLAVAAGQECRRFGIYVVGSDGPARPVRRSNLCRFVGTNGNDTLVGTPYLDFIRGLGGNDFIVGGAGNDRLEGNGGNDRIAGGPGNDVIYGGPGNDILSGGAGNDTIFAGPGHDSIGCGPGDDTVYAKPGDHVSQCEHVHWTKTGLPQ